MTRERIKALLVEDEPAEARLIQETLAEAVAVGFELRQVNRLEDALQLLGRESFDVVLLDLSLPDSQGLEGLGKAQARAPGVPFIILTGMDDETMALKAVQQGAQDYLAKASLSNALLVRAIRHAIERKRLEEQQLHSQKMESLGRLAGGGGGGPRHQQPPHPHNGLRPMGGHGAPTHGPRCCSPRATPTTPCSTRGSGRRASSFSRSRSPLPCWPGR